jgi:hypothetical protein
MLSNNGGRKDKTDLTNQRAAARMSSLPSFRATYVQRDDQQDDAIHKRE